MRGFAGATLTLVMCLTFSSRVRAQEPPPRLGPFVVDFHGTFPTFPNDVVQLANSRGLSLAELPGLGIGVDLGAHVYLLKWRAVTFGIGGELTFGRAHSMPSTAAGQTTGLQPVRERFISAAPQLSFNFGTGHGWSYLSGGIGRAVWAHHPAGEEPGDAALERPAAFDHCGGAQGVCEET